jgi:hypothetical protein
LRQLIACLSELLEAAYLAANERSSTHLARPSGINGMIVTVHKNVTTDPRAPRTPGFLSRTQPTTVL